MKEKEEITKFYDNFVKKQGLNKRHRSILDKLISVGLKRYHEILEMGCGIGSLTGLMANYMKTGNITAVDISPESIDIAMKNLSKYKNIKFIIHDITTYCFNSIRFDCIVLPDVLEHIPFHAHFSLFEKMVKILKPDGFVFIHIPNPEYLEWCIKNRPDLIQIIDEPIHTSELVKNIYPHGFYIDELKTYSIWVKDGDYQYIVLRKSKHQNFSIMIEDKPSLIDKIKYKIK